ncbi:MAG: Hsp20/alpha crystallin family protein [Chloroflexi bacterium]|nr:Hsp20/alpha crystallin family protein [Chloroflexota bacterium]
MASLVRWDPVREVATLRDVMDRLMAEAFAPIVERTSLESFALIPRVDMYETDDEIVVKAVMPGVKPEDLDITITGNVLSIKGEVKEEKEEEDVNYIRKERIYGTFRRDLTLPVEVDVDKAKAEFENGILILHLPKVEAAKPKRLEIKTK